MRKLARLFRWSLIGFVFCYLLIILFPQFLFAHKYSYRNLTVYYHGSETSIQDLESILFKADSLLQRSELSRQTFNQKIFLCSSFGEYTFFTPFSSKAFGCNYPLLQNIFIAKPDIANNTVRRNAEEFNIRTLSGVMAHETVHSLLENKLGIVKYKLLPSWKNEGYCDFVANESSYNYSAGIHEICTKSPDSNSLSFKYFKARLYAEYLILDENISLQEFLTKKFDQEELNIKVSAKYCRQ